MATPAPDLDALLAHADWVRRLGRHLCGDEHRAEDAVQETWLAAMRTPPRHGSNVRGFLAERLRNLLRLRARTDTRRTRREAQVAIPDLAEAAADAAGHAEQLRLVTAHVLALPEPQRGLVLLHYHDDLPVAAIARRVDLTVDAVHGHLKRARATLRARLADANGRRRGLAWLVGSSSPALPMTSGAFLVMNTKSALTAAATVALALLAICLLEPSDASIPLVGPAADSGAPLLANSDEGGSRMPLAEPASSRVAVAPSASPGEVHCRLVGLDGAAPWTAVVRVRLEGDVAAGERRRSEIDATPAADGTFTIPVPSWVAVCTAFATTFHAEDERYAALDLCERASAFAASRFSAPGVHALPVQVLAVLTGRVVDESGDAVAAARVVAMPLRNGVPYGGPRPQTNTSADGTFRLAAPSASEVIVVAFPMHPATAVPTDEVRRRLAVADTGRMRDDLTAAATRADWHLGAVRDVGTLPLHVVSQITGELRAGGEPVAGIDVRWWPSPEMVAWSTWLDRALVIGGTADGQVFVSQATALRSHATDAEGRFALPAPRGVPGSLRLEVQPSCNEEFVAPRVATAPGHFVLEIAPIVTVRVRRGDRPVEKVSVRHVPMATGSVKMTDANGEVRFLRDRAEAQQLSVRAPGAGELVVQVPADAGPDRPVSVELEDSPRVKVRLEIAGGPRVSRIHASFAARGKKGAFEGGELTRGDDGPFEFELPVGCYALELTAVRGGRAEDSFVCRYRQRNLDVGPRETAIAVAVEHGGRIAADVRTQRGVRLGGEVRLIGPDGRETKPVFFADAVGAGGSGRLLPTVVGEMLEVQRPGRYELVFDLGAHGMHRRTVDVRAFEVSTVELVVP